MAKFKLQNPAFNGVSAKEWEMDVPDENKLFKDAGGSVLVIKGGKVYQLSSGDYATQQNPETFQIMDALRNQQSIVNPYTGKTGSGYKFTLNGKTYTHLYEPTENTWVLQDDTGKTINKGTIPQGSMESYANSMLGALGKAALPKNQGEMEKLAFGGLGIDISKLPEYNIGDIDKYLESIGGDKTRGKLTGDELKTLYSSNSIMGQAGQATERDLTGAEAPKLITGANGPVLADGTPIKPEDYAKYGITDYKIPPTTATASQTPQNAQGGAIASEAGQSTLPPIQDPATGKYYENSGGGKVGKEVPAPTIGSTTGNTITDPATGKTYEALPGGTAGKEVSVGASTTSGDPLIDTVVEAVGDVNASDEEILAALEKLKTGQIDPYYKQLISQAQADVTQQINRTYEDRIRQLQTESYNLAENIRGAQKSLEASGMTFSGEAIKQLGSLSAFAQPTPQALTPAQLGQETPVPTMTPAQMGIEGNINMQNRLYAESSRTGFNRTLEDINKEALRLLGTQGVAGLGLPATGQTQPTTTGTMQYNYANTLQNAYGNLANQEGGLTEYNKLFL